MKVVVALKELNRKISAISNVVPAKTTMPILSTVLISADSNGMKFYATDLDVSVISYVKGTVEKGGSIAAPAKKAAEIVRSLTGENVILGDDNQQLTIECGKSKFTVNGRAPEDFPKLPEQKKKVSFNVNPDILMKMIEKTGYAVSTDLTRPAMCGVLWEVSGDGLTMVSTDGHRLAKVKIEIELGDIDEVNVIVPPKALMMLKSYAGEEEEVSVFIGENNISFQTEETTIYSRLLEGPYPEYEKVIPTQNEKELVADRNLIANATKRVSILSDSLTRQVIFSFEKDKATLKVQSQELGDAREEIRVSYSDEPIEVAYNASYMGDILKSIDSDEITLLLDRPDNAGVIRPADESGDMKHMCIIMPLRIS